MRAKITKSSGKNYWYADRIGESFDVDDASDTKFLVTQKVYDDEDDYRISNVATTYAIDKQDCVVSINKKKYEKVKVKNGR